MIRSVKIMPRMAIHSMANEDYYALSAYHSLPASDRIRLISINGSDEPPLDDNQISVLKSKYKFISVDSYVFDDKGGGIWEAIIKRKGLDREKSVPFDGDMAISIMSKIDIFNESDSDELLVVHCHAGISRSGAIGSIVAFYLNLDNEEFKDMNPNIDPNKHIMRVMLKEIGRSESSFHTWASQTKKRPSFGR